MLLASIAAVLGFLYYALLSGLERVFFRVNKLEVELRKSQRRTLARIEKAFLTQATRFFLALQVGKALSLMALSGSSIILITHELSEAPSVPFIILWALGILVLLMLLGEILPRWLFQSAPDKVFRYTALFVLPSFLLVRPLHWLSKRAARRAQLEANPLTGETTLLPYPPLSTGRLRKEDFTENELLDNAELDTEVFSKALQLNIVRVREFMVPRTEIVAMPYTSTLTELRERFVTEEMSRIVIYGESLDEVKGYVHSLGLFREAKTLQELLQPVMFVPESMSASNLLGEINNHHRSIAIVLDEYGGTSGLVTIEDVVEVVFGEIEDEYDEPDTTGLTQKEVAPGIFHLAARLEVEYLNRTYGLSLATGDYATLGGLILGIAERIPATGEVFRCGPYQLTVLQATKRKVELVKLERRK